MEGVVLGTGDKITKAIDIVYPRGAFILVFRR